MNENEKKYLSFVRLDAGNSSPPPISLNQLKRIILHYFYPGLAGDDLEKQMYRPLIVTEINNDYGYPGTVVFSVNGSPPKGVAVMTRLAYPFHKDYWSGNIVLFGNYRISKSKLDITVLKC